MILLKMLNNSKKLSFLILTTVIALSSTAFAESTPMSALEHILRANTYINQRFYPAAHQEIYSAIDDLRFIGDRRAQQAISFLNQANLTLEINEARARDLLNSGETIVERMAHDQYEMPNHQALQDSLDHIYIADEKTANHDDSAARSNLRAVIDTKLN